MNTRRKFLFNGTMAATALLASKPFTSVANSISPVTGFSINNNQLVLAHTGNLAGHTDNKTLQQISQLKSNTANLLLLHAGHAFAATHPGYDASIQAGAAYSVAANDYKIIYKGDIKTGIITANDQSVSAAGINALAVYLKEEKNCHLVICLSQLGYKSANKLDDLSLAASSTHLDVIIGGHATNFCKRPMTARNQNKAEVIINHAATEGLALRKIEIGFDGLGKKHQVDFTRSC